MLKGRAQTNDQQSGHAEGVVSAMVVVDGLTVGRFAIQSVLHVDSFVITYLGQDTDTGRPVHIKEYAPAKLCLREPGGRALRAVSRRREKAFRLARERYDIESAMLHAMDDPGVIDCLGCINENNTSYRITETLEDFESLSQRVARSGPVDEALARELMLWILPVLGDVHATNALHRAVTPDNVLIAEDGRIVLRGFGAARYMIAEKAESLGAVLTPGFAPFEFLQRRDNQGPSSDLYSLGATLYFAITGNVPAAAADRFDAAQHRDPDPLPAATHVAGEHYTRDLTSTIDWMLSLRVQDRPTNARGVMARLGANADVPAVLIPMRDSEGSVTEAMAPESRTAATVAAGNRAEIGRRRFTTAMFALAAVVLVGAAIAFKPGGWQPVGWQPQTVAATPAVQSADASVTPMTPQELAARFHQEGLAGQKSTVIAGLLDAARLAMIDGNLIASGNTSALALLERALGQEPNNTLALEGINHLLFYYVGELRNAEASSDGVDIRVINRNLRRIRLRHPESRPTRSAGFYPVIEPSTRNSVVAKRFGPGNRDFVN